MPSRVGAVMKKSPWLSSFMKWTSSTQRSRKSDRIETTTRIGEVGSSAAAVRQAVNAMRSSTSSTRV